METIKKYFISLGITLGLTIAFAFFVNILNYFDLLSMNTYKVIIVLTTAVSAAVGSYILGKKTDRKGYLEGIKFGIILILLMWIISFLAFDQSFSISSIIYYLIFIITSSIGSMFGINKKTNDNSVS